MNLHAIQLQRL